MVSLEYFTSFLKENNIDFRVENNSQNFDPSFANNEFNKEFTVKVEPENFERVYQLEEDLIKKEVENASEDYYLSITPMKNFRILLQNAMNGTLMTIF